MSTFLKQEHSRWLLGAVAVLGLSVSTVRATDPENVGPYYEDDAWYDISEWFDGNDYNPTDEVIGVWDNETYEAGRNDDDADNDWEDGTYGYNTDKSDDWFYDYYGRYYTYPENQNDFTLYVWYDYNQDANFDAYRDSSNGENGYRSFNDEGKNKKAAQPQSKRNREMALKRHSVNGKIDKMKEVSVAGSKHLVVSLNQANKTMCIDLGAKEALKDQNISKGQTLRADGAVAIVAGKELLIAKSAQVDGKQLDIDRSAMDVKGTIKSTKTAKVNGNQKHLMAIVETQKGKKIAVDLGSGNEAKLKKMLKEGKTISVSGQVAKVNDRRVLFADSIEHQGEEIEIARTNGRNHSKPNNQNRMG